MLQERNFKIDLGIYYVLITRSNIYLIQFRSTYFHYFLVRLFKQPALIAIGYLNVNKHLKLKVDLI